MEKIKVNYELLKNEEYKVDNIIVADQKEIFENENDLIIKGKVFFDIAYIFNDEKTSAIFSKELYVTFSKSNYCLKDVKFELVDYEYLDKGKVLQISLNYNLEGEDVNLERFCNLDEDVSLRLQDYLNRDSLNKFNISDENIIILDPVIKEEEKKLEANVNEDKLDTKNETKKDEVKDNSNIDKTQDKEDIFKEKYVAKYMYYRVKKNETILEIASRFNIDVSVIKKINKVDEVKENMLIQIKKNV